MPRLDGRGAFVLPGPTVDAGMLSRHGAGARQWTMGVPNGVARRCRYCGTAPKWLVTCEVGAQREPGRASTTVWRLACLHVECQHGPKGRTVESPGTLAGELALAPLVEEWNAAMDAAVELYRVG